MSPRVLFRDAVLSSCDPLGVSPLFTSIRRTHYLFAASLFGLLGFHVGVWAIAPVVAATLSLAGRSAPGRSGQAVATTTAAGYGSFILSPLTHRADCPGHQSAAGTGAARPDQPGHRGPGDPVARFRASLTRRAARTTRGAAVHHEVANREIIVVEMGFVVDLVHYSPPIHHEARIHHGNRRDYRTGERIGAGEADGTIGGAPRARLAGWTLGTPRAGLAWCIGGAPRALLAG